MLAGLLALDIVQQDESPLPPEDDVLGLITLSEAKRHLRILSDDQDQDIAAKALAASQIVVDYIDRADIEWTEATVPASVKAAVLLVLGALFEDREGGDPIGRAVTSLLMHYRRPALA